MPLLLKEQYNHKRLSQLVVRIVINLHVEYVSILHKLNQKHNPYYMLIKRIILSKKI
ncbi:unnamed protein product [Paramecium pentaurelia]|uniref:Uncharacterized protein n=1 Tax=Paramecium pentaurelia TaxID=43138 RepID=A0A8S1Y384_9CILI|nr:unnamed protein product [Paramecium pentaurelia]